MNYWKYITNKITIIMPAILVVLLVYVNSGNTAFPESKVGQANAKSQSAVSFDHTRYDRYLSAFCKSDPSVLQFLADDIVVELGNMVMMKGPQAIFAFFKKEHENYSEKAQVVFFFSDTKSMVVEIKGTLTALKDFNQMGFDVKKGQVKNMNGVIFYNHENGKIRKIHMFMTTGPGQWQDSLN